MRRTYQAFGILALVLLGVSLFTLIRSFYVGWGLGTILALVFVLRIFPWPRRKPTSLWDLI